MPSLCVIGMQWGDEGKGKLIDYLAGEAEVVARFAGGSNAGHTVVVNGQKTILHLLPSGILHEGRSCVIGNGVVVDPEELIVEIGQVESRGVKVGKNLLISDRAHVVMPYHKLLDKASEAAKGSAKLGTTLRGIGPCYAAKMSRTGIRMADLVHAATLSEKIRPCLDAANGTLEQLGLGERLELGPVLDEYRVYGERLRPFVGDSVSYLQRAFAEGRKVLFEGAQGSMLDIDFGTYPFVTSSNASVSGVSAGTGVPPRLVGPVLGVVKAYTTRVGAGPFPTEMPGELGQRVRDNGAEYGATTGRPRRCGWLDAIQLRFAMAINGTDGLAITKLDVLDDQPALRICTAYRAQGRTLDVFPSDLDTLSACEPVYEEMPGWQEDITRATSLAALPARARAYLTRIEELLGVPVRIVSVGDDRRQTLFAGRDRLFR